MKTVFFDKNPKIVPLCIILIAFLLVVIPVRNTLTLIMKYFDLKETNFHDTSIAHPRMVSKINEQLLEKVDHTKIILSSLSSACQVNRVKISKIDLPKEASYSTAAIETLPVSLSGGFVPILKSIRDINPALGTSKVSSLRFQREVANREINLVANVIFQSVKPTMDDEK